MSGNVALLLGWSSACNEADSQIIDDFALSAKVSATVVGQMFGFSADSLEKNTLPEVLAVLKDLFLASRWEADKHHRNEKWSPDSVDKDIVDSFETPIPRPSLNERQRRVYSGKKNDIL